MAKSQNETIAFQSSAKLVQEHFKNCGICPELLDICRATELFTRYVIEGRSKELTESFEKMEAYFAEKYKG